MNSSFITSKNNKINYTLYGEENSSNSNCIFLVHGFKGFKDWGFFPVLAKRLANEGFFVVTFNFSHNGVSEGIEFNELDKFAENSYSLEVEELSELILAYKKAEFGKPSDEPVGLLGHSRGSISTIINSSKLKDVGALVTWNGVSNIDRFTDRHKKEWREKGYIEILNARTSQLMKMNKTFLEDMEENINSKLSIKKALQNLKIPYLIIQAEQDLAVKIEEAENLFEWSNKENSKLTFIPKTGHTFDIKHPFEESNEKFENVLYHTVNFFNEKLK